ncbi:TRAP-type uncharacterized transport system substrate-binding protein [Sphingobacterium sp. BIGb0165]|nr:TRAP-type uncharacterized transport system substrate-binding protein [Sphingobacterium sp. BIGb0165]
MRLQSQEAHFIGSNCDSVEFKSYFFIGLGTSAVVPVVYGTLVKIGRDKLRSDSPGISPLAESRNRTVANLRNIQSGRFQFL